MSPDIRYTTGGAVVLAFVLAAVVSSVGRAIIHRMMKALEIGGAEHREAIQARAQQLIRALTLLAYGVAALASVTLALERLGVDEPRWNPRLLLHWTLSHGVNIVIICVGSFIVLRAANLAISHFQFTLSQRHTEADLEWQRRATTLGVILTSLVNATVGFVAILMLLRELSINVLPILTGAGIAGLAIGFGAQNFVRDLISGFFLILEDQVRLGDHARINGVSGTVEQINLRTIVVRDHEGAVQVFPNGTITALANLSKQYAYAVVDAEIAFGDDIDRAIEAMHEAGATMQADASWGPVILGPLELAGVHALHKNHATVRARFKTQPLNQGAVASELRRRLITTFAARGIKPFG